MNLSALETFPFEKSQGFQSIVNKLDAIVLFVFRIWIFDVFFFSGITKFSSWETTLMLFEYEYDVPLIPFQVAALMATSAELLLPILLLAGLFSRFVAAGLFILNFVAAISYPDISPAGTQQHILWGVISGLLVLKGAGKLTLPMLIALVFKSKHND